MKKALYKKLLGKTVTPCGNYQFEPRRKTFKTKAYKASLRGRLKSALFKEFKDIE